ncbi:MAG: alkaline phosphatase family protein [Pelolinea sp.]|nr:alkaline phosphatase family protein [Pelolinea sp.]
MQTKYDQILNIIRSQEKPAFLAGGDYVVPAYQGLSIANLPASISRWLGCPLENNLPLMPIIMDQFESEYEQVILLLVDGLSLSLFKDFLDNLTAGKTDNKWESILARSTFCPLTSIVPSTTSATLTTLWTGAQPIKHGIIGYELFLKEFGCITNMITHSPAAFLDRKATITSAGFDPGNFLPMPTLGTYFKDHGVRSQVFQHQSISGSGLSQMLFKDVDCHSYRTESDLWYSAGESIPRKDGAKTFTYIYWGELDTLSHRFGPHHPRLVAEWNTFACLLHQFISTVSSNKGKTLFILSADHGQIPTDTYSEYDLQLHPELIDLLIMNPTGESRLPFLFIKNNREEAVNQYLSTYWNGQFNMISSEEFILSELLGKGEAYIGTINRLGHSVVIPKNNAFWWWVKKENLLRGRHGGLSPQEMLVPFFAVEI